MSCQLTKLSCIADLKAVKKALTFVEEIPDEDESDVWNNSWEWGDGEEDVPCSSDKRKDGDKSWLQECVISLSPAADLLAISYREQVVFLTSKWDVNEEGDMKTKFFISYAGILSQEDREEVTSLLCLPLASQKRSLQGGADWTCVVVGFSSGYIRIYTEKAVLLLSQLLHEEPIMNLRCQTYTPARYGCFSEQPEEVVIIYPSVAVIIDGFALFQTLRACRSQLARATASKQEVMQPPPLTYKKWGFQEYDKVTDCETAGTVTSSSFDHLMSESIHKGFYGAVKSSIPSYNLLITTGSNPYVGFYHAKEGSTHLLLSEVAQAVKSKLKTLAGGFFSHMRWTQQDEIKNRPSIEPPTSLPLRFGIHDKRRQGVNIVVSSNKCLAAVTDTYGRVILFDLNKGLAVRMWKGYRDAHCGWIEVEENIQGQSSSKCQTPKKALFLVIYAPRRGILEVWSVQQGPRVAAFNVGRSCRLLCPGYSLMGLNSTLVQSCRPQVHSCYLMDSDGVIRLISIPFHCALSERNSKRVRDLHLLKELRTTLKSKSKNKGRVTEDVIKILLDMRTANIRQQALDSLLTSRHSTVRLLLEVVSSLQKYLQSQDPEQVGYESKLLLQTCLRVQQLISLYQTCCQISSEIEATEEPTSTSASVDIQLFASSLNVTEAELGHLLSFVTLHQTVTPTVKKHVRFLDDKVTDMAVWEFMSCFAVSDSHLVKTNGDSLTLPVLQVTLTTGMSEEQLAALGGFLFHDAIHNGAPLSTLHYAFKESGILPEKLLILLLHYWLSDKSSSTKPEDWLNLQQILKSVSSLAEPHMVSIESDRLSPWWEMVRMLLSHSTNNVAAFVGVVVARSVSIMMASAFQVEYKSSSGVESSDRENNDITEESQKEIDEEKDISGESDWESVSLDLEQWNLLVKQLEDVLLLSILLKCQPTTKTSIKDTHISMMSLLNGGPGVITDLVAAWVVSVVLEPDVLSFTFTLSDDASENLSCSETNNKDNSIEQGTINLETVKGLLCHLRRRFPRSMDPNAILANCSWEHMVRWNKDRDAIDHLTSALCCLRLVNSPVVRNGICGMMWKTFIQKRFEALTLLIEKVGKTPKERLCRKELEMSDNYLEQFLDFCCSLLDLLLEANVVSEVENLPMFPPEDLWQGRESQGPAPLITMAMSQKSSTYYLVYHHLLLTTTMLFVVTFQLRSIHPLSFYDSMAKKAFFQDLHCTPPIPMEGDATIKTARIQFILKVASAIAQSIPESLPDTPASVASGFGRVRGASIGSTSSCLQASKWFNRLLELGRGWGVNLDEVRRHYVCELYASGHDSLAEEARTAVTNTTKLGCQLLLIAGQRLYHAIMRSSDTSAKLAHISPELSIWLRSLGDASVRCVNPPLQSTAVIIDHIIVYLPEDHPETKRAVVLLDAVRGLVDFQNDALRAASDGLAHQK